MRKGFLMFLLLALVQLLSAQEKIYLNKNAGDMERYAAAELQRYIYQLSGKVLSISDQLPGASATGFVLATTKTNGIEEKLQQHLDDKIGEEGYILEKQNNLLYIAAKTELGCLYAVYGLLRDHYGIGFYLGHDVVPFPKQKFYHVANGNFAYQLTAVNKKGEESERSPYASCLAGSADNKGPHVILVSPPSSIKRANSFSIKLRLLDNRLSSQLSAFLLYRRIGETKWMSILLANKARAVFAVDISLFRAGAYEYHIIASDGKNKTRYPAEVGNNLSFVVEEKEVYQRLILNNLLAANDTIRWQRPIGKRISFIKVYRSPQKNFRPGTANFVCYLPAEASEYVDNRLDFNGIPMKGTYYYFVSAVDADDHETIQHTQLRICYR